MAKKFNFPLQKLMDFKEQLFETERMVLAEMNAVLNKMKDDLASLYEEHRIKSAELVERLAQGITTFEMTLHKNYLVSLEEAIREKHRQIAFQEQAVERQMDKVREAKLEISSMEKLKEKRFEEYVYKESKAEELFIEEFVSNTRATAGLSM